MIRHRSMSLFLLGLTALFLLACAPQASPTPEGVMPEGERIEASATVEELPTTPPEASATAEISSGLPPEVVLDARTWLATQRGVPAEQLELVAQSQEQWSDSCLGLGGANESCMAVVTPGWRVIFNLDGEELEVRTDESGETIRLAPTVGPRDEGNVLEGRSWRLVSLSAQGSESFIEGTDVTLTLRNGTVEGNGGCNSYSGTYQVEGNHLSFHNIISTRMACADDRVTQQEQRYLRALERAGSFERQGNSLQISYDDGEGLLTFEAGPSSPEAGEGLAPNPGSTPTSGSSEEGDRPEGALLPDESGEEGGAAQTILDYFHTIEARRYDEAYLYWKEQGAASGQSLQEFREGYQSTIRFSLLLDDVRHPPLAPHTVEVDVRILAVDEEPGNPETNQIIRGFSGTYTLERAGMNESRSEGWVIASASVQEASVARLSEGLQGPEQTLASYFDAIDRQAYPFAYSLWARFGQASGQPFEGFKEGFAGTTNLTFEQGKVQMDAGAGSVNARIPIIVISSREDGSQQTYCGFYNLRRANLPPFDQLGWRIENGHLAAVDPVPLHGEEVARLLDGGCPVP